MVKTSGRQSLGMLPRNFRPCGRQRTPWVCRQRWPVYGLLGVPPLLWVISGQNGAWSWGAWTQRCSMWVRKFGDGASESSTLWEATGPVSIQAWEACMGPTRCTPVALSYKGSEGGSNLGPVANNDKNIASGWQSLGMLPRNSRPCGRQRTPWVCRQGMPVYGLLGVPPLLWDISGQNGARSWGA